MRLKNHDVRLTYKVAGIEASDSCYQVVRKVRKHLRLCHEASMTFKAKAVRRAIINNVLARHAHAQRGSALINQNRIM